MHGLGLIRDAPDSRDLLAAAYLENVRTAIPESYSIRPYMPPVRDQGKAGKCVAFAVCAAIEAQMPTSWGPLSPGRDLSEEYLYWKTKEMLGFPAEEGLQFRDGLKAWSDFGVCHEALWAYDGSPVLSPRPQSQPSKLASWIARRYRPAPDSFMRLTDSEQMLLWLVSVGPFVLGIEIHESFMRAGGTIPVPRSDDKSLGGHALTVCGFDRRRNAFELRNSWSAAWGDQGYAWLPFEYLTGDRFWDAWGLIVSQEA